MRASEEMWRARVSRIWAVGLVLTALSACAAWAQPVPAAARRPKIGLVLSGGGARGAAHVGVLQVLEANNVSVDLIVGTSMGAIVGGLYATGMSASELEASIEEIDWLDMFEDRIPRQDRSFRRKRDDDSYLVKNRPGLSGLHLEFPPGLLDGRKIDLMLKRYTLPVVTIRDFDALPIPYRAVATDLVTGAAVVLDHGDLAMAMRASMSIPVVFIPREIDGRLLVDGGMSNNIPIDVARALGAEVVIAVDISAPLQERDDLTSVLAITDQLTTIMTRRNADEQIASLTARDVLIRPDLADVSMASFERVAEAIAAGVRAAEQRLDQLLPLAVPGVQAPPTAPRPVAESQSLIIDEVRVLNHSRLADAVIKARLEVQAGDVFDVDRLEKGLAQVYGLEHFESVHYDLVVESGRQVLIVDVREAAWGPNYLQFGIAIFEGYEGPNFNLGAAYMRTGLNRLNGEWRTGVQIGREPGIFTEFYQPLSSGLRPFGHGGGWFGEEILSTFDAAGKKLGEFGVMRWGVGIAAGRELGTWGEMRLGLVREDGDIEVQVGEPSPQEGGFSRGLMFAQFFLDELDDLAFPRSGATARLRVDWALEALGSDVEYEQGQVEASLARSRGRNTIFLGGMLATTRNSDAPIHSQFHLGGFTRISGYERDELQGQHTGLLFANLYRRIWSSKWLQSYAGLSFEYGNVFQSRNEIRLDRGIQAGSAFLGLDTPIGPVYLAYGLAEGGRRNFYFFLGEPLALRRAGVQRW